MAKLRAELQILLNELAEQTRALVRDHPDDGDFWSAFAGASDFIVDDAGPNDYDWVSRQIDRILQVNGRTPTDLAPSDDLPPN
jgi:hypothetical protein